MSIITRYLIWEMIPPFLVGVFGFVLIMVTDVVFTFTDLIINKGVPIDVVLKLLLFKLPAIMVLTFPVSTLFATAMALTRLSKDNEMTALRTSGMSVLRMSGPIMGIAFLVGILSFVTNERVVPWANHVSENIIRQMILKQPLTEVKERVFFKEMGDRYFYIEEVDPKRNQMKNVMIYEAGNISHFPRVILAKEASWSGQKWTLKDGVVHKYEDKGTLVYQAHFSTMSVDVRENLLALSEQRTPQEMSSRELGDQIKRLREGGVSTHALAVDFHLKFAIPATCLVFALIGIPFSLPRVRSGQAWGLIFSIALVFTYYVFASICRSLGRGGAFSPIVSAWLPHLIFGALGSILLLREEYFHG